LKLSSDLFALFALSRLAYGHDTGSASELASLGLRGWVEEQIHPNDAKDAECATHIHI
jgi:hypothetical protein